MPHSKETFDRETLGMGTCEDIEFWNDIKTGNSILIVVYTDKFRINYWKWRLT